jgi:hypothetical protein
MKKFSAAIVCLLACHLSMAAHASSMSFFATGSNPELITKIPIDGPPVVALQIPIGSVAAGATVFATAKLQVTNNNKQEAFVAERLWLIPSLTVSFDPATGSPVGGIPLDGDGGTNCTPVQHHCDADPSGLATVKTAMPAASIIYVTRTEWTYQPQSGAWDLVDSGPGMIKGFVYTP